MRGGRAVPAAAPVKLNSRAAKKRVLFVCIGNSCRSPMAEAFARAYGSDILIARSAGLAPATIIQPLTKQVLLERNIAADDLFPKSVQDLRGESFDLVVNLSGMPIPDVPIRVQAPRTVVWPVLD